MPSHPAQPAHPSHHIHLVISGHATTLAALIDDAESLAGHVVRLCPAAAEALDLLQQDAGHLPCCEGPIDASHHLPSGCLLIRVDDALLLVGPSDWLPGHDSPASTTNATWEIQDGEGDHDEEVHDAGK